MLDSESRSDTIPAMDIKTRDAAVGHEAKIGAISNDAVFYLMSRGMSEEDARANPPEKGRSSPNPTRLLRPLFRTPKAGAEQSLTLPRVHPPTRPTRHHPRPPGPLL